MGIRQFEQDEHKFYGHPLQMKSYTVFVGPLFGFQKKIVRLEELFNVWTQRGQKKSMSGVMAWTFPFFTGLRARMETRLVGPT
jgi:hypothetical protein